MVVGRGGAAHRQSERAAHPGRLGVEVVQHLDVVGHEADGGDDRGPQPPFVRVAQVVAHVRLQPRVPGPPAAALVDQDLVVDPQAPGHQGRGLAQLRLVAADRRHRRRDAVRREDDPRRLPHVLGKRPPGGVDPAGVGLDEPFVGVPPGSEQHLDVGRPALP